MVHDPVLISLDKGSGSLLDALRRGKRVLAVVNTGYPCIPASKNSDDADDVTIDCA